MMGEWVAALAIIGVLIVLSAFFSGSETALTAASRPRIHLLANKGNKRARIVLTLLDHKERFIGAILLGNNLVNILGSALATYLFINAFGDAGVFYATVTMTLVIVIFAEVLPKTYAIVNANRSALAVAGAIRVVVYVLAPVTTAIQWFARMTVAPFGVKLGQDLSIEHDEEELRGAIDLHDGE
ncbi:MAG: CNNM domain-containing protein, partial [Alphaproteobacteria bacterium]